MKRLVVIAVWLVANAAPAQNVEQIANSGFAPSQKIKNRAFDFLLPETDTAQLTHVATYRAVTDGKKSTISGSYFEIWKRATKLGANCFKLAEFQNDSLNNYTFVVQVFFAVESELQANASRLPTNQVFVFGNETVNDELYSLKVNDIKREFKSGTYLAYQLEPGQTLKLNKGGFTGATAWLEHKQAKPAIFLTVSGFGLGGALPPTGTIGVSFNTGRITRMDDGLGFLLVSLLKPGE
jgi:hypothetical protein